MAKEQFKGENLLNEILAKQPDAVTYLEKDILRARISYLTAEQIDKYGLREAPPQPKMEEEPVVAQEPVITPEVKKKSKKSK